jgi:hypothetical protein
MSAQNPVLPQALRIGEEGPPETWDPTEHPVPVEVPAPPPEPVEVPERVGLAA